MRTRLRLGAATAVGLGALLLATVLASPALAWHSNVTVNARCLDGQVRVHYTVEAWEKGHEATVDVSYELNGKVVELESDDHFFAPKHNQFSGHFDLPAGTTGKITFTAVAHWKGGEKSSDKGSDDLPPADKCEESTTTTSKSTTTTMEATTTTEAVDHDQHHRARGRPVQLAGHDHHPGRGCGHQHHWRGAAALHRGQLRPDAAGRARPGRRRRRGPPGQPQGPRDPVGRAQGFPDEGPPPPRGPFAYPETVSARRAPSGRWRTAGTRAPGRAWSARSGAGAGPCTPRAW